MNRLLFLFLAISTFSGCSVFSDGQSSQGVKGQRLVTDFTDEGVKLFYTIGGKLEKIEVYGQAEAWKGNVDILAEADAYTKLVKFIHGSQIKNEKTIKLLGRAIEKAEDSSQNRTGNADTTIASTAMELDSEDRSIPSGQGQGKYAQRAAKTLNETLVTTITNITSQGRLNGVRKVRDSQAGNGRIYIAVYQWSEKDQTSVNTVRNRMAGKE